jgi:glutaredoxin
MRELPVTTEEVIKKIEVTVFSKNNCPACERMKSKLRLAGIQFEVRNIDTDMDAMDFIVERGHRAMPVVYLGDQPFDTTSL